MSPEWPANPESNPETIARLSVALHRLDKAHRKYRVHAARVVGIGPTELSALLAIFDNPGITPGALGRDVVLSSGAVTAVTDRLEASGYITAPPIPPIAAAFTSTSPPRAPPP